MNKRYLKEVRPSIPSDLASVPTASRITGFRERTIWKWIRTGKVKAWGRPRCYRVSISELLAPVR
jgi:hypothetical protein